MRNRVLFVVGSAAGLLLLFVLGFEATRMMRSSLQSPSTSQENTATANPIETPMPAEQADDKAAIAQDSPAAVGQLKDLQAELQLAARNLQRASPANKGGLVEKSRDDVAMALDHVSEAIAFVQQHPETGNQPARPSKVIIPENPTKPGGGQAAPNVQRALNALRNANDALGKVSGGDLGGFREKIEADIKTAASDIVNAIKLVNGG